MKKYDEAKKELDAALEVITQDEEAHDPDAETEAIAQLARLFGYALIDIASSLNRIAESMEEE